MARSRKTFRKVITSESLIEQINPENKKLMEKFLKNFATKRSPNSVTVYKSTLQIFLTWNLLENDNKRFVDIRKIEISDFFDYAVTELHWNSNRFATAHSCLSSFSTWIENYYDDVEGYEHFRNLLPKIEKPVKENIREKTVLKQEDIDNLIKHLETDGKLQDLCLLSLAISCGARVSELARFTTDLIDENNTVFDGLFLETTKKIATKGRGVNGKMLTKYILKDQFLPYYKKWLPIREQVMKENNQEHNFIFITKDGKPANSDRLRDWISTWGDIIGRPSYPHLYRHRNISMLRENLVDDDLIVYLTGWAEGSGHNMIAIYDDAEIKDKKFECLDNLRNLFNNK
jgi:site-specific recombinase XerD